MRFTSTAYLLFVLVTLLATSSFVSSLSIRRAAIPENDIELIKRGAKAVTPPVPSSSKPVDRSSSVLTRATTSRANASASASGFAASSGPATDSVSTPITSGVPTQTGANMSTGAAPAMTSSSMLNATGTTPTPSPETGVPTPVIAAIGGIAGAVVLGGLAFVVLRKKNSNNGTQNLVSKDANQFPSSAAYNTAPYNATGNTGYERLSDPSLSAGPIPNNASSPSVGTFTVISTYTPTLGDELEIQPGDKVTIIVEYDDGWCQGVNESRGRVKGVFPKHCVDMGTPMDDQVRGKRVSSMYGNGYRM